MPENVRFAEVQKMSLIWHILDVFELLSVPIEPIPFPFYQESSGTSVDYPHHNFLGRLKIHFLDLIPPWGDTKKRFWNKKTCFGCPGVIGNQIRYLWKYPETKWGESDTLEYMERFIIVKMTRVIPMITAKKLNLKTMYMHFFIWLSSCTFSTCIQFFLDVIMRSAPLI